MHTPTYNEDNLENCIQLDQYGRMKVQPFTLKITLDGGQDIYIQNVTGFNIEQLSVKKRLEDEAQEWENKTWCGRQFERVSSDEGDVWQCAGCEQYFSEDEVRSHIFGHA